MNPIDYMFENLYRNIWGMPGSKERRQAPRPARRWTWPVRINR